MSIISKSPFNFNLSWGGTHTKPEVKLDISQADEGFIKLIVGLGNFGDKYDLTRHNIGFEIIDCYALENSFPKFKENKKFFGLVSEKFIDGKKYILLKPTTLMNLSGKSIQAAQNFYNISPEDITVAHDELDLDFGDIRSKVGGEGKSSHNGLKDLTKKIGSTDFKRIRFGIKNDLLEKIDAKDFVLGKFSKTEQSKLKALIKQAVSMI